jgi:dTDP-4-dehydrorhamnose 3,5-epimerase
MIPGPGRWLWYKLRLMNTGESPANLPEQVTPVQEQPSVTPDGVSLRPRIDGVKVRYQRPLEDARGEVTEVYRPSWGLSDEPLVYVYQVSVRPGAIKGWVVHERQDDRLFHIVGTTHWALFDNRLDSPTNGMLNELVLSEKNRALLIIPRGVYHAVQNIGTSDAIFVNMPTRPYDHGDPDKFRLPLKNALIPFSFSDRRR